MMNAIVEMARGGYLTAGGWLAKLEPAALLLARLLVAREFWRSGLGKVNTIEVVGLRLPTPSIENSTYFLFGNIYFPNLPEWFTDLAANLAALGELTLPLLLAFGLFARIGALGLLIMTVVIQIFVFPDAWWGTHAWWAAILFVILTRGPGALSVDRLIGLQR